jgi:hypothetical protein
MNYSALQQMIQHFWRGGYALGLSFWVFGAAGSLVISGLMATVLLLDDDPSLLLILVFSGLSAVYQVWASVGIWRSAAKYPGSALHAHGARAIVVVNALYSAALLLLMINMLLLGAAVLINPPFIK